MQGLGLQGQAKCLQLADQDRCESMGCEWVLTDDVDDCILTTTTTTTTTTTADPGCCMGDSAHQRALQQDGGPRQLRALVVVPHC